LIEHLMSTDLEFRCNEVLHVNVVVRGLQTDITQFSYLYGILSIETFSFASILS
jgi:hypothetical protein